jgi:hypothetical protein
LLDTSADDFPLTSGMTIAVQLSQVDGAPDVACWSREPLILFRLIRFRNAAS